MLTQSLGLTDQLVESEVIDALASMSGDFIAAHSASVAVRYGSLIRRVLLFFFQAEDGIRDHCVTGVQTCALPISLVKSVNGCHLLLRRFPGFPIHAGCSFASVFCYSPHSKGFAAKRAGEQTLQGFHLVPLARLSCLRDTDLQPTNSAFGLTPVDLVPV